METTLISSYEQLEALPIGSQVWKIENNEVMRYTIVGKYPSEHIKSIMITYGTNKGCSQWIGGNIVKSSKIYTDYVEAVNVLIKQLESDIEAIKRIYLKQAPTC